MICNNWLADTKQALAAHTQAAKLRPKGGYGNGDGNGAFSGGFLVADLHSAQPIDLGAPLKPTAHLPC